MASIVDSEKFSPLHPDFQFGLDGAGIAQQLRAIADAIDARDVLITKATIYHSISPEDFKIAGVVLQFAEKSEASRSGVKELHSGSGFPVAVAALNGVQALSPRDVRCVPDPWAV